MIERVATTSAVVMLTAAMVFGPVPASGASAATATPPPDARRLAEITETYEVGDLLSPEDAAFITDTAEQVGSIAPKGAVANC